MSRKLAAALRELAEARAALAALQEEPDVVRDHPAPRLRGRCIGCLSTDWPICRGCGADLSGECSECHRELGVNGNCDNCVEARFQT